MSVDVYLSEVNRIIRENFRSNDPSGGMAVASAAYLVKNIVGHDQTVYGFAKFKDVLNELESRGLVTTGTNSKGAFSVWIRESTEGTARRLTVAHVRERFRPLRNQVWFAFVSATPPGHRFLNRKSGEVLIGVTDHPPDGDDWIAISPIDPGTEREIALQFLRENDVEGDNIVKVLESDRWFVEFPKLLADKNPALAWEWKRERSRRVIEVVHAWCNRHNVDERLIFEEFISPHPQSINARDVRRSPRTPSTSADDRLRHILLAAIERMPTEDLLKIRIPSLELIAILKPDLLV